MTPRARTAHASFLVVVLSPLILTSARAEEPISPQPPAGENATAVENAPTPATPPPLPKHTLHTAVTPRDELAYDLKVDIPVTIIAGVALGTAEALKTYYGPTTCRWCDTPTSLNAFDASARHTMSGANRAGASIASDVLAYGAIPVFALGLDLLSNYQNRGRPGKHWAKRFGVDTLLILESTVTALALHYGTKLISARRRPLGIDEPTDAARGVDGNLSFFSGHTTLAFVVASTVATELSLRRHKLAPVAWAVGMAAATTVAMLRVGADSHFATDTLVGAVVGSAIGVVVPLVHRGRAPVRFGGTVTPDMAVVSVGGRF